MQSDSDCAVCAALKDYAAAHHIIKHDNDVRCHWCHSTCHGLCFYFTTKYQQSFGQNASIGSYSEVKIPTDRLIRD